MCYTHSIWTEQLVKKTLRYKKKSNHPKFPAELS